MRVRDGYRAGIPSSSEMDLILLREIAERANIYSFSDKLVEVPARHGFALRDAIDSSQLHNGTYLGTALAAMQEKYDRLIVITDEQAHDKVPALRGRGYVINVGSLRTAWGTASGCISTAGAKPSLTTSAPWKIWEGIETGRSGRTLS